MERLNNFLKSKLVLALSAVVLVTFFTISLVNASTTIGNDINTAGQLIVSGVASLNGGININNGNFTVATDGAIDVNDGNFTVNNEGMVGLGNSNPEDLLDIAGNLHFKGYTYPGIELDENVEALDIRKDGDGANHMYLYKNSIASLAGAYGFKISPNSEDSYLNNPPLSKLGIGTITPTAKLEVVGGTDDKYTYAMKTTNSSNEPLLFVRNDGKISIGYRPPEGVIMHTLTIQDVKPSVATTIQVNGDPFTVLYLGGPAGYGLPATQHSMGILTGVYDAYISYKKGTQDWGVGAMDGRDGFGFYNNSPEVPTSARGYKLFLNSSTGNVSVGGEANPTQQLEVNGGMRLNTATAKPTCDSDSRGTFWFTKGTTGGSPTADTVEVCAKDGSDVYAWRTIY